jgi:hypothetical protein
MSFYTTHSPTSNGTWRRDVVMSWRVGWRPRWSQPEPLWPGPAQQVPCSDLVTTFLMFHDVSRCFMHGILETYEIHFEAAKTCKNCFNSNLEWNRWTQRGWRDCRIKPQFGMVYHCIRKKLSSGFSKLDRRCARPALGGPSLRKWLKRMSDCQAQATITQGLHMGHDDCLDLQTSPQISSHLGQDCRWETK